MRGQRSRRRRKPTSSSKSWSPDDLARNIAQETVSTAVRLREQLSRDQPAPPLALRSLCRRADFEETSIRGAIPEAVLAAVLVRCRPGGGLRGTRRGRQNHHIDQARHPRVPGSTPVRPHPVGRPLSCRRARKAAQLRRHHRSGIQRHQFGPGALRPPPKKPAVKARCWWTLPATAQPTLDGAKEIASCLDRVANKQIHLVLPASMKRRGFAPRVQRLCSVPTGLSAVHQVGRDGSHGAILSAALEAGKPLSYFANGQNIPEDIEPAQARVLLSSVFRPEVAEAVTAA